MRTPFFLFVSLIALAACATTPLCSGICFCTSGETCDVSTASQVTCTAGAHCVGTTNDHIHVTCQSDSTCDLTVGPSGSVDCAAGATCDVTCQAACSVTCGSGDACARTCADMPGTSAMTGTGGCG